MKIRDSMKMKNFYFAAALLLALISTAAAQELGKTSISIVVRNEETKQPVAGAKIAVRSSEISATTGADGAARLSGIPDGEYIVEVSSDGYETRELKLAFPSDAPGEKLIFLKVNRVGEVIVSTTRTGREIEDVPTRIEAIDEEEIDEKSSMRSSNVSMVLNESTGIKVQQTSATSATQSVRIQGLDGRYTQLLKDGFPAFGGFSGSLGILDIPPLDLKQVEIIKGPAATFYGGGAIAGVINFISKEPQDEPSTSMIFNQTSALGTDFSLFNTRKFDRFAYTLLGSVNYQKEYDVDDDDFTELPKTRSFGFSPRLFFSPDENTRFIIGNSTSYQNREGGDVFAIGGRGDDFHRYFERNRSLRNITTVQYDRDLSAGGKIIARQSLAFFDREIEIPDYAFRGRQFNSYADVSYFRPLANHSLVFGFSAVFDRFREKPGVGNAPRRDETRTTLGGYAQDSFDLTDKLSVEAGFRLDYAKDYGAFALPRVSMLYRFTDNLSSRVGFGFGYKTPSVFTEEAETLLFRNVLPVANNLKAERSRGVTLDVNYRNAIGEKFSYSLNQMFFYTRIEDPLVLRASGAGRFGFANAAAPVKSSGFETNVRMSYDFIKLFAGYTFTNAKAEYLAGEQFLPLTAKNKLNSALLFEKEEDFKAGVEAYYTGGQFLSGGFKTESYWVLGVFGEKNFGKFSLFVNAENITDTRQSRFGAVVSPPHQNPTFAEIYTHTEGRVFNGGIKIRL